MPASNQDQEEFWTSNAGPKWVTNEAPLDAFLGPVLDRVIELAGLSAGQSVLDIGCGTGQSALQSGQVVGPTGQVVAADISPTMLERASLRTAHMPQVKIVLADAADYPFENAQFDHVVSRFGVMFFADPVAAFRNIAGALKPGGKITFATWGRISKNPWFTLPAAIAKAELGAPPKTDPDAPGPFAFRDIPKVVEILRSAGLEDVTAVAEDMSFTLPGGAADIAAFTVHVGPASGTITHFAAGEAAKARIEAEIARAFGDFDSANIPAEINFFTATKR